MTLTDGAPPNATASPSGPAARAVGLVKTYGTSDTVVRALDGIDIAFGRGHFTAVMGPSGSGKSTLMHCMAGLDTPTSGQVFVGDEEISTLDDAGLTRLRRDRIGFVFQSFNLVPTLTAREEDVLPGGQGRYQIERLEYEADPVPPEPGKSGVVEGADLLVPDEDLTGGGGVEACHAVHEGRLARARRPHHGREMTPPEGDVDAVQGTDDGVAGAVGLYESDGTSRRPGG